MPYRGDEDCEHCQGEQFDRLGTIDGQQLAGRVLAGVKQRDREDAPTRSLIDPRVEDRPRQDGRQQQPRPPHERWLSRLGRRRHAFSSVTWLRGRSITVTASKTSQAIRARH
jgi:hypothetical protein